MIKTKRIRIGNQTSFSAFPVTIPFEYAVAHGFDAFEWFPDKRSDGGWTENDISQELRAQIRNTALVYDIQLSVHTSWPSNPLNLGLNELPRTIGFAQDIGATLLNIHFHKDAGIAAYSEALTPIVERLVPAGIKLSIENTPDTGPQDFNELFRYLHSTGITNSGHIGMCLDMGHANLCNETRNDYLKFIDLLDSRVPIIHIHLHENYGDFDSHLPLFTGPAGKDPSGIEEFIKRLKKRNFSGCIILEQWPQPEELLDKARQQLLEMIDGTEKLRSIVVQKDLDNAIKKTEKMIVYNIFPLLAGKFTDWEKHFLRASEMGFNWVFVNPIQLPGASGSIYSIADYFAFNPLLVDPASEKPPQGQVKDMIKTAKKLGLKIMIDLVINHCAVDSKLIKSHPEWFLWKDKGQIENPFVFENGRKVIWKDLAKFDHRNTRDKEGLFQFFLNIVKFMAELGFKGFRCDAAYQVPKSLWERLIGEIKKQYPDLIFFAETLGSPPDLTRKTASAGFDYIFNSSKWWNFSNHWLMEQYALTRDIAPSISFPESHDTARLCNELNDTLEGLKQRYLFSAIFSSGVMMPIGFEFGFRRRLHVVKTRQEDWEETGVNLISFIAQVNKVKAEHAIFQEDAPTEILPYNNPNILLMWKASTNTQEETLIILNKDICNKQYFYTENLQKFFQSGVPLVDVSPEYSLDYIPMQFSYDLRPGQGIILITSRDSIIED